MSHIVRIDCKIHDAVAVHAACRRLGLSEPVQGNAQLFSGEAAGLLVQLPKWQFPVVIDTLMGSIKFDNYGGAWGDQIFLDRLLQSYAVEKAKLEACKKGFGVTETALNDGSIRLQIMEGH